MLWDVGAATISSQELAPAPRGAEPTRELTLRCGGRAYVLDSIHPRLTIGRDTRAHVVVQHARVSRLHGRIEYRKNTFVFVDESTNGTQVLDAQAELGAPCRGGGLRTGAIVRKAVSAGATRVALRRASSSRS